MKSLLMNPNENNNPFSGLTKLKKAGILLLLVLIITFYVLSIQFLLQ